jgi:PPE-repeat protein
MGAEGFAYLVGGIPAAATSSNRAKGKASSTKAAAPSDAATATASTREMARASRRRRAKVQQLGRGYEYMDLDDDLSFEGAANQHQQAASSVASDRGAGMLGFSGTADKTDAEKAAGLTTLAGDTFGGSPTMPMMPNSWSPGTDEPDTENGDDC